MTRLLVADDFEALAAATVLERGPVPIKASKGRTRPVFTVGPSGEVTGIVPHAAVVQGLLVKQGIADAVVEGARPERVVCESCPALVPVKGGPLPRWCAACKVLRRREKAKSRYEKERIESPEKAKERAALYREKNRDRYLETSRKRQARRRAENPEKFHAAEKARYAKNPKKQSERAMAWQKANPGKKSEANARQRAKRRALKLQE